MKIRNVVGLFTIFIAVCIFQTNLFAAECTPMYYSCKIGQTENLYRISDACSIGGSDLEGCNIKDEVQGKESRQKNICTKANGTWSVKQKCQSYAGWGTITGYISEEIK